MKNLPLKDRIFWKNFFWFILIFLCATFVFSLVRDEEGHSIGFIASYNFMSIFCVLYLGVKIGQKFSRNEEITEKISIQEFREKYKGIIDIYNESISLSEEELKPFNEILSDRRIINFLSCVAPKKGEEYYDEYHEFYRRLNKGKPLEEIFGKDKDGSRCFLIVRKKPKDFYEIEFGSGWGEIESTEWQGQGSSRTWQVTFAENDSAICGDEIDVTFYD